MWIYSVVVLRLRSPNAPSAVRPLVGILASRSDTYGRAIVRGAARYANLRRRWLLFKDLDRIIGDGGDRAWPALDGAIFAGTKWPVFITGLTHCRHAVYCSSAGEPDLCPIVGLDDYAAGVQAAQHLLNCRLERFAYYFPRPSYRVSERRFEGFRDIIEARGFSCEVYPYTVSDEVIAPDRADIIRWLHDLPKPVGIMAFDDTNAHDLAEACLDADIGVPDHVAIIGVNNDDLLCECAWPPLSSVEADYSRVGYIAAQILDRMLAGETLSAKERVTIVPPLGVVQRQSTTTLAIRDPNLANAVRFIREHACDPCSVSDVLRVVPVGRRWLERQFVAQLRRTPHEEIARVRIETGQRLLRRSDLDMRDIARKCGFAELKNFYAAFRKVAGTTPAVYRRKQLFGA